MQWKDERARQTAVRNLRWGNIRKKTVNQVKEEKILSNYRNSQKDSAAVPPQPSISPFIVSSSPSCLFLKIFKYCSSLSLMKYYFLYLCLLSECLLYVSKFQTEKAFTFYWVIMIFFFFFFCRVHHPSLNSPLNIMELQIWNSLDSEPAKYDVPSLIRSG